MVEEYNKPIFLNDDPLGLCHQFNNIKDVMKKISNKTAAIIVELIQGEAGVISAQNDFVEALRNICNENNILLIFDEVQSGIGRTGTLFAYQGYGVAPDILTLAKGLGGGLPIAATITTTDIAKCMQPGTHGSTLEVTQSLVPLPQN